MRFSLIDRVTDIEAGQSISAVKNLSLAEEYLADHFPGFAVMPGVMMLETLVQAGGWLIRYTEDFAHSTVLLKQARAVKFNSFVTPGQTLAVTAKVQKQNGSEYVLKASGAVDGKPTVSAKLTLDRFNLVDRNPTLAKSDERIVKHMREIFGQIWS
jgi:3-hydroxyacyl-[acyl-carrier-protein] dehydratase